MKATVIPQADIRGLSKSVIRQALVDLDSRNPVVALDALAWFTDGDFPFWAEMWDMPFADPYKMLPNIYQFKQERRKRNG